MPELGYQPTNKYLPPRSRKDTASAMPAAELTPLPADGFLGWVDRLLSR
jgi:sulfite dehydrogenase (quinone) subunit SoeB